MGLWDDIKKKTGELVDGAGDTFDSFVDGVKVEKQIDVLKLMVLDANLSQSELPQIIAIVKMKMGVEEKSTLSEVSKPTEVGNENTIASKVNAFSDVVMSLMKNKMLIAVGLLVGSVASFFFPTNFLVNILIALVVVLLYVLGLVMTLYFSPKSIKIYLYTFMAIMVLSPIVSRLIHTNNDQAAVVITAPVSSDVDSTGARTDSTDSNVRGTGAVK